MASKFKKGDKVIVLSGKDKGKQGVIKRIVNDKKHIVTHAYVENVRLVKKAKRPNPNKGEQGGIVEQEAAIAISNLAIYNPISAKADRVGFKIGPQDSKQRIFRSSGEQIDV